AYLWKLEGAGTESVVRQPVGSFLSLKPVQARQVGTSKILSRNVMAQSGRAGVGGIGGGNGQMRDASLQATHSGLSRRLFAARPALVLSKLSAAVAC
ncbi:hypothetical protein JMJ77_0006414, partial [Colletotrichum scovillei]